MSNVGLGVISVKYAGGLETLPYVGPCFGLDTCANICYIACSPFEFPRPTIIHMRNDKPTRKNMRLPHYDYSSPGHYFVTTCVENYRCCLSEIKCGKLILSDIGKIVEECWHSLPHHYMCRLDTFVVMPNHIHGIVILDNVREGFQPSRHPSRNTHKKHPVTEIIRGFKTFSSRKINMSNNQFKFRWKRSFYDHVIRSEADLHRVQKYIYENPGRWEKRVTVREGFQPSPTS